MEGWEGKILVTDNPEEFWGGTNADGTYGAGFILHADSEALEVGQSFSESQDKIGADRAGAVSDFTMKSRKPAGELTFQPRFDDMLPFLAAHFQAVGIEGGTALGGGTVITGTFTFAPVPNMPDWSGTVLGTVAADAGTEDSVYCLSIVKYWGDTIASGMKFIKGIVDKLVIKQDYDADLIMTPTFKFGSFSIDYAGAQAEVATAQTSSKQKPVDYQGTVTFNGEKVAVDSFSFTGENASKDKTSIGYRSPVKYPLGKYKPLIEVEAEFDDKQWLVYMASGTSYGTVELRSVVGTEWMTIEMREVILLPEEVQIGGGNDTVNVPLKFHGYPQAGKGAVRIKVFTSVDETSMRLFQNIAAYGVV